MLKVRDCASGGFIANSFVEIAILSFGRAKGKDRLRGYPTVASGMFSTGVTRTDGDVAFMQCEGVLFHIVGSGIDSVRRAMPPAFAIVGR